MTSLKIAGFPVQVQTTAWLIVGLVLLSRASSGPDALLGGAILVVVLFGSILVHELGHAFAARRLGLGPCRIVLHGFGGLTSHSPARSARQGLLISSAGPGAGLSLGLLAILAIVLLPTPSHSLALALQYLAWINIFWSLFNLLPMRPMDGGMILVYGLLAARVQPVTVERIVKTSSLTLAVLVVVGAVLTQMWFVVFIGILVLQRNLSPAHARR